MDGRFADAMKISNDCKKSIDSNWMDSGDYMAVYAQYLYMTPYFTLIRFGKWNEILNTSPVPETRVYANLIWHYGRGLAYAREHSFENANAELELLRADMQHAQLQEHPAAFNPGIAGAEVAEKILDGVIAEERGDLEQSITLLKEAVEKEDNMLYNEPKDWVHPARQYLGNVLIKVNRYAAAEKVFREDLEVNPNNGWSLTGMVTALVMQGKKRESNAIQQQLKTSFARSDTKIIASVF
jgi:tetratricopeptide (TPR) repeat protein